MLSGLSSHKLSLQGTRRALKMW